LRRGPLSAACDIARNAQRDGQRIQPVGTQPMRPQLFLLLPNGLFQYRDLSTVLDGQIAESLQAGGGRVLAR
jgi:hypothetical protein